MSKKNHDYDQIVPNDNDLDCPVCGETLEDCTCECDEQNYDE